MDNYSSIGLVLYQTLVEIYNRLVTSARPRIKTGLAVYLADTLQQNLFTTIDPFLKLVNKR